MLTKKNAKAWAVLAIVYDHLSGEEADFTFEPYLNGRESGFSITNFAAKEMPKVSFSENRNSDQIVVYTGKSSDFSMQGNTPGEQAYKNANYFGAFDYVRAAHTVLEHLGVESWLPVGTE